MFDPTIFMMLVHWYMYKDKFHLITQKTDQIYNIFVFQFLRSLLRSFFSKKKPLSVVRRYLCITRSINVVQVRFLFSLGSSFSFFTKHHPVLELECLCPLYKTLRLLTTSAKNVNLPPTSSFYITRRFQLFEQAPPHPYPSPLQFLWVCGRSSTFSTRTFTEGLAISRFLCW